MKELWAPWRNKFLTHAPVKGCIFCKYPRSKRDAENLIIGRGKHVFSILNLYPYNNGHVMIVPYRHLKSLALLKPEESAELFEMANKLMKQMDKLLKPHGYNVGFNIGRAAGAGIDKHVHMHIVPRWIGDTNFMPVLSGTKVISESLKSLRARLAS